MDKTDPNSSFPTGALAQYLINEGLAEGSPSHGYATGYDIARAVEAFTHSHAIFQTRLYADIWDEGFTRGFYAAQNLPRDADASEPDIENPYEGV